jgi:hypothetical protein
VGPLKPISGLIIQYLATNFRRKAATDIVSYRTKNGKFKDIAGSKQVRGVEAAKY